MPARLNLEVPATLDAVPRVRRVLTEFVGPDHGVETVRLAVTEAVANVVVHAYRVQGRAVGTIDVVVRSHDDGSLTVEVDDEGCGVVEDDPTAANGFGVGLMRALTAEFELETGPRGTHVKMRFDPPAPRP
jgi:anti-sigma regulatory factor (Ser/Thr protein kinase)